MMPMVKGVAATTVWYDFPNVFRVFARFGPDSTGSACLRVHVYLYVYGAGVRDLVEGVNGPEGT